MAGDKAWCGRFLKGREKSGYRLGHVIGSGSSGTVLSATRLFDNVEVAAKCIHVGEDSEKAVQNVLREARVLADSQHPNIVKLLEVVQEDTRVTLVLERADSGDLTTVMHNGHSTHGTLNENRIMFGFVQVALALHHLHSRGVLHRDIKPQNVVVHKGKFMKLCDFGAATSAQHNCTADKPGAGTASYLAPEIWQGQPYTEKSDVWALGCVLYEMVTLRRPYDGPMFKVMRKILAADRQPIQKECSQQLRNLVNSMLQHDPKLRPTMKQILTTPYVFQHLCTYVSVLEHEGGNSSSLGVEGLHEEYMQACASSRTPILHDSLAVHAATSKSATSKPNSGSRIQPWHSVECRSNHATHGKIWW